MDNLNLPRIFDLDKDTKSTYGKHWIGDNSSHNKTPFKQTWRRDLTHFRHCLTIVNAQPFDRHNLNTTHIIIKHSEYEVFDHIANLIVSFRSTPITQSNDIFQYINRLTVEFGSTQVLDLTGSQLELVAKQYPDLYRKMTLHTDSFVIPIQALLMEEQPVVFNYDISIRIQFADEFLVFDQVATFEGYRSNKDQYKLNKICASEKHIYTYQFLKYNNSSSYVINTPIDVPIHKVIVINKTPRNISVKFGDIDMIPCSNPYFEFTDTMIPINDAFCYIVRPPTLKLPNLTSMTGLVIGSPDLKISIELSDKTWLESIDIEVMLIIDNTMCIESEKVNLMVPIEYEEFMHEPIRGSPLYKINDKEYIEGYWASVSPLYDQTKSRVKYNLPIETDFPVDPIFLKKLSYIIHNAKIRGKSITHYYGFSDCRICNKANGCDEFTVSNGEISFRFPSGLMHYYEDHHVQPSDEFFDFVMELI